MKYSNSNFGLDGRGAKLAYFISNKVQAAKIYFHILDERI